MFASGNQADLPGRELMCVNDAFVCRCMTQITMIWALSHTGASGRLSSSPAVLCDWLLELISVFFSWKMPNMCHVRLSCCVTRVVYRSGVWFYYVNIWISVMRIFRRRKKSESAPSWCCKSQFFNTFYGNRTTKWLIAIITSAQHGQIS